MSQHKAGKTRVTTSSTNKRAALVDETSRWACFWASRQTVRQTDQYKNRHTQKADSLFVSHQDRQIKFKKSDHQDDIIQMYVRLISNLADSCGEYTI